MPTLIAVLAAATAAAGVSAPVPAPREEPVAQFGGSVAVAEPILVSARAPVKASQMGGSVTVLTAADLERLQAPLLVDILRLQPGVTFSRNGGAGGFAAVRLRGAEGEQTMLVIDGVKVADTASPGGGTDFATLGTQAIGRVEILRGPQSLAWGSQAIGGVIAIETRAAGNEPEAQLRAEGGSRGNLLGRADASGRLGPARISAGANWQRTDGISSASEARGSTERDDFESWGANLRADIDIASGLVADLRGRLQSSEFGLDGFPPPRFQLADTAERSSTREASGVAGLGWRGDRIKARLGWQLSDIARRNFTPDAGTSFRSAGRLERLDLRADWEVLAWLTLAGGLEREIARLETRSSFAPDPFGARAALEGGFLQAVLAPHRSVTVLAGFRHDQHSRFGGATTLGASASWQLLPPLRLKASFGEGFKAPTLFQLYSDFGNAELQPERAFGWDIGAELKLLGGNLRLTGSWFEQETRNQIDFLSCFGIAGGICTNRPSGTYTNIRRTRARGLELALGMDPAPGLIVEVQLTLTDAANRTAGSANFGRDLPRRPGISTALLADYKAPPGWSVGATLAHVSESFDNAANSRRIEGYVTADLRGAVPLGEHLELTGRITNLFDATYETASFYGQPGRQGFVGLRARF